MIGNVQGTLCRWCPGRAAETNAGMGLGSQGALHRTHPSKVAGYEDGRRFWVLSTVGALALNLTPK